ncbi:hypothetical protein [Burkholderia cenocepacia]|uniref:hypothetical protein n=1 Tax=Burkholderia cenocepacia TaxID=95486 RepID=UPI0022370C42|nr:hypothetical protein [Burkholderia cenocepacia]MCW5156368.1 hypothetical protein [Burkholderia cenocepacia]
MSINVPKELNWKKEETAIAEQPTLTEGMDDERPKVRLGPDAPMKFSQIWQEIVNFGNMLLEGSSEIYGGKTIKISSYYQEQKYQLVELDKNNELLVMKQTPKGFTENFFFVHKYAGNFPALQEGKDEEIESFFKFYDEKKSLVGPLHK